MHISGDLAHDEISPVVISDNSVLINEIANYTLLLIPGVFETLGRAQQIAAC